MVKIGCKIYTDCPQAYSGHRCGSWYEPQKIADNTYYHIFSHEFSSIEDAEKYISNHFVNTNDIDIIVEK